MATVEPGTLTRLAGRQKGARMYDRDDSMARLRDAERYATAARHRSGWYAVCLWVFTGWQLLLVPTVVLWRGPIAATVVGVLNATLVMAISWYAGKQSVVPLHFTRRHLAVVGAWAALYVGTVLLSATVLAGSVPLAVLGALACALPPAAGALRGTVR
ncbi:hypothetical protein ACSNOK_22715 [Streptomyces sp. URMC 126]|uniref:hypothetical protein n=1 Tax=Streptomyces sp. URMC 126 TaxID=3423401 RepID=UPI003F1B5D45